MDFTQFSTAVPLISAYPNWIGDKLEQQRIAAYMLYEQLYWNAPEAYKLVARGKEDKPIYIPSAMTIVETMQRYLAPDLSIILDPAFGQPSEQELATQVITDFLRRERFISKFNSNKRYGIIRGDWIFYLQADPNRAPGSRVSIFAIDPASYFPIYQEDNLDVIIGAHVVDTFEENGKTLIKRETWRKATGLGGPSPITYESAVFKIDEWGGPGLEEKAPQKVLQAKITLPSPIDDLPFYHIRHFDEPGTPWGSSELRGIERLLGAINQAISDEDLTLAMEGLGVYATTAGTPQDEDGNDAPWNLGPGRVVELPGGEGLSVGDLMARITGTTTVSPYQDHLKYMHAQLDGSKGMSAVVKGNVDVTQDISGIALRLEMGPILSVVQEKETNVTDVLTNLLFNLPKWYIAYEGGALNGLLNIRWIPKYGDKIPPDYKEEFDELMTLAGASPKIVPASYIRQRLRSMPRFADLPDEATLQAQIDAENQAALDMLGARMDATLGSSAADGGAGGTGNDTGNGGAANAGTGG